MLVIVATASSERPASSVVTPFKVRILKMAGRTLFYSGESSHFVHKGTLKRFSFSLDRASVCYGADSWVVCL
jgi:hypothetical protein